MEYRIATQIEIEQIKKLLSTVSLHNGDVSETIENCIVAIDKGKVVGTAAIECRKKHALLKSFAVSPSHQKTGIGKNLFQQISSLCYQLDIQNLFLLTTDAESYFTKFNFIIIGRDTVPKILSETTEFQTLCPASAICMQLDLGSKMQYYPKSVLKLKNDIDGVKQWGVSLKSTQLTFFEVESHKEFDMHRHESEQITYILEGELYFKSETETICVKEGEAIAIPSNLRHGAFTREKALKAVDAWSPINDKYK